MLLVIISCKSFGQETDDVASIRMGLDSGITLLIHIDDIDLRVETEWWQFRGRLRLRC